MLSFDGKRDFPYYRKNPHLSKTAWIVLLLTVPVSLLAYSLIGYSNELAGSAVFCLIMLIPLLYFSKWDYSLIFKKPTKSEIILAFLLFIGYMIYAMVIGTALEYFGLAGTGRGVLGDATITWVSMASLLFSMMAEELLKFIPLMFFMRLIYKFTENRSLAIIISSIIILIGFGLLHYSYDVTIASVLLLQGLGTIFELYGYLKTKNILVPYMSHLFTDGLVFLMIILGLG